MEIILVWNNVQSFKQHAVDMKKFSQQHKNNFTNELSMLKNMPLPGDFKPLNAHGGSKIQISTKRKSTLVPLWEVELPIGAQN